MGPLFGAPLLLVEGDDDYRIWSQVPRHHCVNIAVIPTNGEEIREYQRLLEQIFGSLLPSERGPVGYALLDGDKSVPTPNPSNTQHFVRFIGLGCHEAENLYLSDEVLDEFDLTWDAAKAKIVSGAADFGLKEALLLSAETWDRKTSDIKDVIEQLSLILDPKSVHWTMRVGRVIGRARPEGQLAEMLGEALIQALWGEIPEPPEDN